MDARSPAASRKSIRPHSPYFAASTTLMLLATMLEPLPPLAPMTAITLPDCSCSGVEISLDLNPPASAS